MIENERSSENSEQVFFSIFEPSYDYWWVLLDTEFEECRHPVRWDVLQSLCCSPSRFA